MFKRGFPLAGNTYDSLPDAALQLVVIVKNNRTQAAGHSTKTSQATVSASPGHAIITLLVNTHSTPLPVVLGINHSRGY